MFSLLPLTLVLGKWNGHSGPPTPAPCGSWWRQQRQRVRNGISASSSQPSSVLHSGEPSVNCCPSLSAKFPPWKLWQSSLASPRNPGDGLASGGSGSVEADDGHSLSERADKAKERKSSNSRLFPQALPPFRRPVWSGWHWCHGSGHVAAWENSR